MDTYFAPAKKTEQRKFENQRTTISHSPIINALLKTLDGFLVILNEDRQVVSVNQFMLETLGIENIETVLGLRLGQVLSCVHAEKLPNGCGTTPACMTCGAVIAMMTALIEDKADEQICVLTRNKNDLLKDICLKVRAQPIIIENHQWILFFAQDITQQQQWLNMERVFFHDVKNILTTLVGNNELLAMELPDNKRIKQNKVVLGKLCDEVSLQMDLLQQKGDQYLPRESKISIADIRKELHAVIEGHTSIKDRSINETWPDESHILYTDSLLLIKVLSNMLINALEATDEYGEISINVQVVNDKIIWKIWNQEYIPEKFHNRIFQKFFSTKPGTGRGLGTYSMKIYGEKFLKGKVGFSSDKEGGTVFSYALPF